MYGAVTSSDRSKPGRQFTHASSFACMRLCIVGSSSYDKRLEQRTWTRQSDTGSSRTAVLTYGNKEKEKF
jgi:hypothetical protein